MRRGRRNRLAAVASPLLPAGGCLSAQARGPRARPGGRGPGRIRATFSLLAELSPRSRAFDLAVSDLHQPTPQCAPASTSDRYAVATALARHCSDPRVNAVTAR